MKDRYTEEHYNFTSRCDEILYASGIKKKGLEYRLRAHIEVQKPEEWDTGLMNKVGISTSQNPLTFSLSRNASGIANLFFNIMSTRNSASFNWNNYVSHDHIRQKHI